MIFAFPLLLLHHFFALLALTISPSSGSFPVPNASESQLYPSLISESASHSEMNDNAAYPSNATDAVLPSCFSQPADPSQPQLHAAILDDCLEILFDILRSPVALTVKIWDPRFREFPVWNVFGTCAIGILPKYQTSRDIFIELLVAHVAAVVIDLCVKEKAFDKVGGIALLGPRKEFEVCVYGRDPSAVGRLSTTETNATAIN